MFTLKKEGFNKENIISFGNMFLIGNGHLGYRGTLEEYGKSELVGLNVVGIYDKYQDLWRESVNMPNPFKVIIKNKDYIYSCLENEPLYHYQKLDIKNGLFSRHTEYNDLVIDSSRFVSSKINNLVCFKYTIKAKEELELDCMLGLDQEIYEINGPHFKKYHITNDNKKVKFVGITNENKELVENVIYKFDNNEYSFLDGIYSFKLHLLKNETSAFYAYAFILDECLNNPSYQKLYKEHINNFNKKWDLSRVELIGNKEAQDAIDYSIYHLLILGNPDYSTSIPARGVSGETYKGAIFWDTEIFMVPFFTLTNPKIARKLLEYRINTLPGALAKAKEFGYVGAFYAWESQDTGLEACSKYNVTEPLTGKPIRTYFNEKQIHISFDIVYAIFNYYHVTHDETILDEAQDVLIEVARFAKSYSTYRDNMYHIDDVIGPDEYHERINDNAFTTYLAYYTTKLTYEYLVSINYSDDELLKDIKEFLDKLYLPQVNNNLLEQFSGYFNLEDTTVDVVRSRLYHPMQYWGGATGPASTTRVIKQADVIALLVLEHDKFDYDTKKACFDYYYPYTEHGSSLSSSMYSILASLLGYHDISYKMFLKSATIDLGTDQKMFAGGIYIGGTHPASNGGSYLSLIFGMAGLSFNEKGFSLNPHLPKEIKGIEFKFIYQNKLYNVVINKDNTYIIK